MAQRLVGGPPEDTLGRGVPRGDGAALEGDDDRGRAGVEHEAQTRLGGLACLLLAEVADDDHHGIHAPRRIGHRRQENPDRRRRTVGSRDLRVELDRVARPEAPRELGGAEGAHEAQELHGFATRQRLDRHAGQLRQRRVQVGELEGVVAPCEHGHADRGGIDGARELPALLVGKDPGGDVTRHALDRDEIARGVAQGRDLCSV